MTAALPDLPILYRDAALVAVHKPPGLLVHPSWIDRSATTSAMQILRDRIGAWVYPVHRLDRAASGVLLFALDPDTARRLTEAFTDRRVEKTYLAVVRGWTEPAGVIDHPLREEPDPVSDRRARRDKDPQPAVTEYRRLAQVELPWPVDRYPAARYSLVQVRPLTGRRHQIRRHLKHISHHLVGDTTHGKSVHNRLFQERLGCGRMLLAGVELTLGHPATGRSCRLVAPLEGEFAALVRRLGWAGALPGEWLG